MKTRTKKTPFRAIGMPPVRVGSREQPNINTMTNLTYDNWGVGLCHATGELIQDGFYFQQDDVYFSTQAHLFEYFRSTYYQRDLSDKELTEFWYATDEDERDMSDSGFYYSVWVEEDGNINYIQINGQIIPNNN